ncbi:hypothetical protein ES703_98702 [subsurface metagenome]
MIDTEGPKKPHFDQPDLLSFAGQKAYRLIHGLCAGAHHHHNPLSIGSTQVVEEVIPAAGYPGKPVHCFLHDTRGCQVVLVYSFTGCKKNVRILGRSPDSRTVRAQAPGAVCPDQLIVDHGPHIIKGELFNLLDLMGGSESVKKVQERNPGFQG